jgi:hypothetical protein
VILEFFRINSIFPLPFLTVTDFVLDFLFLFSLFSFPLIKEDEDFGIKESALLALSF